MLDYTIALQGKLIISITSHHGNGRLNAVSIQLWSLSNLDRLNVR
jgi:hypothetical protein